MAVVRHLHRRLGARYDIRYQNNGANVNLTGSPDYAARVVITGTIQAQLRFSF